MKKLIATLGALGIMTTGASSVIACGPNDTVKTSDLNKLFKSVEGSTSAISKDE